MNGLLSIYKKEDVLTEHLAKTLKDGLKTLSHRGSAAVQYFLLNSDMQTAGLFDARLAAGACVSRSDALPVARIRAAYGDGTHAGGKILFFDGRLINRDELCGRLTVASGGMSDAEIVLSLMEAEGTDCFRSLKGFWSLIYIDAERQVIYGARDHFGCRPLFFCNSDRHFALASESRTLYTLFDDVRRVNRQTVIDFLLWGSIGKADQYFFSDIMALEPSHYVKYEAATGLLTVERYYTLPYNRSREAYRSGSEGAYLDGFARLLTDSVHRNISLFDGALAVGVSGGMDSSSLICAAKKTDPQRTLVAYTTTDRYDGGEVGWAEKVVRHTGAEWIKVVCTSEQILEQLAHVNRIHNVPLYNASSFAQYRIMEEIGRQGQAVFIDGQGGDEMLGGYPVYFPLFLQSLRRHGEWGAWRKELLQVGNSGLTVKEMFLRRLKLWAKAHYYHPQKLAEKKRRWIYDALMPDERTRYFDTPLPLPLPEVKKEGLNDALFESYTIYLANILRWGEHSAAALGLECVMPLSDSPDLTEYAFSIPSSYKIHDGWNKYLLRKSMTGIVPDEICRRKQKMGFYIPELNWLNEMGDAMLAAISAMDDPEECINKTYLTSNWKRLYVPSNPLFQQFAFRCFSYLLWREGLSGI
jgi:asparagine synthase (glutamine-hydrolysing)